MQSKLRATYEEYKSYEPTQSCFLDGRYIAIALAGVPEFSKRPIYLDIGLDGALELVHSNVRGSATTREGALTIMRLIVTSSEMSHSALVWIDSRDETITFTDVRDESHATEYMQKLDKAIDHMLQDFFSHLRYSYKRDIAHVQPSEPTEGCNVFGYCNAYVIKQVLDYSENRDFDPREIRRFAAFIEHKYRRLLDPDMEPEIEYRYGRYRGGWGYGGLGLGLGAGLLAGAALSRPYYQPYPYPYYPAYGGYPAYGYGYPAYGY